MKRINLKTVTDPLSNVEMKSVTGGDDPPVGWIGDGDGICAANKNWLLMSATYCGNSASEAIAHAGANGHWCCNCEWAKKQCGCS